MSKRAKDAAYRNPGFMGGLCAVCRKKMRNYQHADYPSMCDGCRMTRLKPFEVQPSDIGDVSTARSAGLDVVLKQALSPSEMKEAREIARKMFERDMAKLDEGKKPVQNLKAGLHPALQRMFNKQETGK